MKKKDLVKLRKTGIDELDKLLKEKKIELIRVKANIKAGKEQNLKKAKNLRHEIAQTLTILKQSQILAKQTKTEEKDKKTKKGDK